MVNFNKYKMPTGILYETYIKTQTLNNYDDENNDTVINEDVYNKLLSIISSNRHKKNKTLKLKRKNNKF